jgi:signal transduction histidine kinase
LLTRISIHTELIKHAHLDIDKNKNELNKIAETSRLATTTMSDVLWSVDARNDKAGNLIDRMREHADMMLLPLGIKVIFNHNLNSDKTINLTVRQELFLIFKECIHNIAKHSKSTEVTIDLKNGNGKFEMYVSDNGKINAINSTHGQGLKNMKMRAEKIAASIEIWQQNGFHVKLICKSI